MKIWITQFHGTKNINFICNSGPAAYSLPPVLGPKTVVTSAAPTYSLCGRDKTGSFHEDLQKVHFILYTVMKTISLKTFLKKIYKSCDLLLLSIRLFPLKSPGPAAYKVVDPCIYGKKPPQYSMTGRNFTAGETTQKPGPGAHYPEKVLIMSHLITTQATNVFHFVDLLTFFSSQVTLTKGKAPSFSFGLRHSQYISPLIVQVLVI